MMRLRFGHVLNTFLAGFLIAAQDPDSKAPVPDSAALRKAERTLRDMFKKEIRSRDVSVLRPFARRLLEEGAKPQSDAALHYAMLDQAREIAAKAQDLETSFAAVDRLAERFAIDAFDEKLDSLSVARKAGRRPDDLARTAAGGIRLAGEARKADQYAAALKVLKEAGTAARSARRADFAKQVGEDVRLTNAEKKEFDRVVKSRKRLETSPDDAASNLTVGKWLVFRKRDFDAGLPLLAKGSDRKLAEAAKLDAEAFDPVAIGDAWMKLATNPALSRDVLVQRACIWLRKAWEAAGSDKDRLRQRLGQILSIPVPEQPRAGASVPGWPGRSGVTALDGSRSWSGQFSAKLLPHPGNARKQGFTFLSTEEYPALPGAEYRVSVMALTEMTGLKGKNDIGIWIAFKGDEPKPLLEQSVKFPVDTPVWTRVEGTFTCPPGAKTVHVSFHMAEPEGSVWVDDTSLICEGQELLKNGGFEGK